MRAGEAIRSVAEWYARSLDANRRGDAERAGRCFGWYLQRALALQAELEANVERKDGTPPSGDGEGKEEVTDGES
jgi:hypothetical protein